MGFELIEHPADVFLFQAADKGEVAEYLNNLMSLPGTIGYVVINFDGKWKTLENA